MRLEGKIALVTAAGQGIGRASALALAAEGAQVWATDLNPNLLETFRGVERIRTSALDVLDKAAIEKLVAGLPPLDVLFNCAGFVHNGSILEATDADWDFAFNLNVRSQFWMIRAVLPAMLAKGGGSIINMASVCGSLKGLPNRFIYGSSKAAVGALGRQPPPQVLAPGARRRTEVDHQLARLDQTQGLVDLLELEGSPGPIALFLGLLDVGIVDVVIDPGPVDLFAFALVHPAGILTQREIIGPCPKFN
jgi:hypothetical protein